MPIEKPKGSIVMKNWELWKKNNYIVKYDDEYLTALKQNLHHLNCYHSDNIKTK